ncbi:MAG: aminodeoxychorismate/anthranilate synthase component II [Saprospiraceae bacterium]|nr:aminodeoxychorismate/anthranilate synthase component II [Saprospiraceae bacterium]
MTRKSPANLLLIDNFDSFTYNLYDYLLQLGARCEVRRNNVLTVAEIEALRPDGIVLSPGPQTPEQAGCLMEVIDRFHREVPLLGICLGHQGIGQYFGARLGKADLPMHGKTSRLVHREHPLFAGLPTSFSVMRYHSLVLHELGSTELEPIAESEQGEIMAIAHRRFPAWGVQFHPESILTEHGHALLRNWLAFLGTADNC